MTLPIAKFGAFAAIVCALFVGCDRERAGVPEAVWGEQGHTPGRLQKPRAITIDGHDRLYLVDMTARIQVFSTDGRYLRGWETPEHKNGRPTGLGIDRAGNLLVADTHYFRVLVYSPEGKLLETVGGIEGHEPGTFGLVTSAEEDSHRNLYVAEYGEYDRIQKFGPDHKFIKQWGSHGSEPGQFARPQKIAIDDHDRLYVTDACNHRIQVFNSEGKLLDIWGRQGSGPGELDYPYDIVLDGQGHVCVVEFGNHRVQKFTLDGKPLGYWGTNGRGPGELHNPWGLVRDSQGALYVLDTNNHRVQKFRKWLEFPKETAEGKMPND